MKVLVVIAILAAGAVSAQEAPPCTYVKNLVDPVSGDTIVQTSASVGGAQSLTFKRKNWDFSVGWFGMWLEARPFVIGTGKPMYLLLGDSSRVRLYAPRILAPKIEPKGQYFPGSTVIDADYPVTIEDLKRIAMNGVLDVRVETSEGDTDIHVPARLRLGVQDAAACLLLGRP